MSLSKLCFSCDLYLDRECFNDEEWGKGCFVRKCNRCVNGVNNFENEYCVRRYDLQRAHEEGYYCNETINCNCNCCESVGSLHSAPSRDRNRWIKELNEKNTIDKMPDFINKYKNEVNMISNGYLNLMHKGYYEYLKKIRKIRKKGLLNEIECQLLDTHFPNDYNIWERGDSRVWIRSIKLYLERSHNLENVHVILH